MIIIRFQNPFILRLYLRIRLLDFDFITYQHIPRRMNTLTDAIANIVLDRHLRNYKNIIICAETHVEYIYIFHFFATCAS